MKILYILFFFLFISCNYQESPKIFETKTFEKEEAAIDTKTFAQTYQDFLDEYVVKLNQEKYDTRVNYKKVADQLKTQDPKLLDLRSEIEAYLASNAYDFLNTDEKIALIINAYNYFVIKIISENYPIDKIINIQIPDTDRDSVFQENIFRFNGQEISLDRLEKVILKNLLEEKTNGKTDARLHFALICGAKGCPILLTESYESQTLEEQLDFITKESFKLPRILKDRGSDYLLISLFNWYDKDFLNHSSKNLKSVNNFKDFINYFFPIDTSKDLTVNSEYDWTLNEI